MGRGLLRVLVVLVGVFAGSFLRVFAVCFCVFWVYTVLVGWLGGWLAPFGSVSAVCFFFLWGCLLCRFVLRLFLRFFVVLFFCFLASFGLLLVVVLVPVLGVGFLCGLVWVFLPVRVLWWRLLSFLLPLSLLPLLLGRCCSCPLLLSFRLLRLGGVLSPCRCLSFRGGLCGLLCWGRCFGSCLLPVSVPSFRLLPVVLPFVPSFGLGWPRWGSPCRVASCLLVPLLRLGWGRCVRVWPLLSFRPSVSWGSLPLLWWLPCRVSPVASRGWVAVLPVRPSALLPCVALFGLCVGCSFRWRSRWGDTIQQQVGRRVCERMPHCLWNGNPALPTKPTTL